MWQLKHALLIKDKIRVGDGEPGGEQEHSKLNEGCKSKLNEGCKPEPTSDEQTRACLARSKFSVSSLSFLAPVERSVRPERRIQSRAKETVEEHAGVR